VRRLNGLSVNIRDFYTSFLSSQGNIVNAVQNSALLTGSNEWRTFDSRDRAATVHAVARAEYSLLGLKTLQMFQRAAGRVRLSVRRREGSWRRVWVAMQPGVWRQINR